MPIRITWEVELEDDAALPEPNEAFDITNDRWSFLDAHIVSIDHIADEQTAS